MEMNRFMPKIRRKSQPSLDKFLEQEGTQMLKPEQAFQNINNGLAEIVFYTGLRRANGILVTDDGYVLMPSKCLKEDSLELFVRLQGETEENGNLYPINIVYKPNDDNGLALVKANIPGDDIPKEYNFCNLEDPKSSERAYNVLTIRDRIVSPYFESFEKQIGYDDTSVIKRVLFNPNHFLLNTSYMFGDEGSPVVLDDGSITGFVLGGFGGEYLTAVKVSSAFDLLRGYREGIKKA